MNEEIRSSFDKLRSYVEAEDFSGYDPYDTLLSPFPFKIFTSWGPVLATQFQKRNPVNIRPLLGIKKEKNPKAIALFLEAYISLAKIFPEQNFSKYIEQHFTWLRKNYTTGFNGYCWGYNFPWATPEKHLLAFSPTAVTTSFVIRAIHEYYLHTRNEEAKQIIFSAAEFVTKDLKITESADGVCFSYTPFTADCCYNASLLAAEILARADSLSDNIRYRPLTMRAVDYVIKQQHADGHWNYSRNITTGEEREQIDFHQGYILDCLKNISELLRMENPASINAIKKGLNFYREKQFFNDGRSLWRLPKEYPVEIHNQSQGIITFSRFSEYDPSYFPFAKTISEWTVRNMQDKSGYFYYRKNKLYTNKISFMRWSNAWMFLALTRTINKRIS